MTDVTEEDLAQALKSVYDPEISINVYDLGLIYKVHIEDTENGNAHVHITHTLTSVMCPFAEQICNDIYLAAKHVNGVKSVQRELVFEPPFSLEMMPMRTKLELGLI